MYEEILRFLREHSSEQGRKAWLRYIKVHEDMFGVKLVDINPMITQWARVATWEDIDRLWDDGRVESRIIAAKVLGKWAKRNPDKVLDMIARFCADLKDWATTDTLATQTVRPIVHVKKDEIQSLALECLKSANVFARRFGIVLFIHFPREATHVLKMVSNDRSPYIKKAVEWVKRKMRS